MRIYPPTLFEYYAHRERSVAISTTSHEIAALPSVARNDSQIKHLIFYRQFWAIQEFRRF